MGGVSSSSLLLLLYHNRSRTPHWGGTGVINSSPLPFVDQNRIVEHLKGEGGGGEWDY